MLLWLLISVIVAMWIFLDSPEPDDGYGTKYDDWWA